ncbi:MAG: TetR/AcrR family transcriptional regulator [Oscillospiraceae bacterium]|nr:TetR/AcrR family transcriptional regulator [Oscillospiraceae bacterium]
MRKVDLNKKFKENTLLKAAFDFFTTKGFSKTSITDIVNQAGVAKGTFYLYFKDKYDIRNRLISHKSSQLFRTAVEELGDQTEGLAFEDRLIRIIDNIINQLSENQSLLNFISKNLSWGIFKNALTAPASDDDINFSDVYYGMLAEAPCEFQDPEIMLFMIIELVSATCYSAILYEDPCSISELKPHLYDSIRLIIARHKKAEKALENKEYESQ